MALTPILVGVAQHTQARDVPAPLDPLGLMAEAARAALADTKCSSLAAAIDAVWVVNIFSWSYADAPGTLAQRLGLAPRSTYYSAIGGNTPQQLVNRAAHRLATGDVRAVLLAGAEAVYAQRRAMKGEVALDWPDRADPERIDGAQRAGTSPAEDRYDLFLPAHMYPFFETALQAYAGRDATTHQHHLGAVCSRLAKVAQANPLAWSPPPDASPSALAEHSPSNRLVAYPYTLRMTANINVDQSAALVLTTTEEAERLGIPEDRWVYVQGGADLNDVWHVTERPALHRSPALGRAARAALAQAGAGLDAITAFDLYSCFPSAVEIALAELGLGVDDPRPLTLTGGLPYFGGPGNNYSMHAIVEAAARIRADRAEQILVTALGWYLTKHSAGVYGGTPGLADWSVPPDLGTAQAAIEADALAPPVEQAEGALTVEAFSIRHDRAGLPERGVVIGRLDAGDRALADIGADAGELATMEQDGLVGRKGSVAWEAARGRNVVRF